MTYIVNFVGIIYFHVCSGDGDYKAFFPDGRNPGDDIPPHDARLLIEVKDHDADNWWRDQKSLRTLQLQPRPGEFIDVDVFEFTLPERATVTFSSEDRKLDLGNLRQALPGAKDLDPDFTVDPKNVKVIAEVPLTGGKLEAQSFESAAVVQWTVTDDSEPITITAQTDKETRRITLKPGGDGQVEVVFSNTSDLIPGARRKIARAERAMAPVGRSNGPVSAVMVDPKGQVAVEEAEEEDEDTHAAIYGQLDVRRNGRGIAKSDFPDFTQLPPCPSTHAFLNFLRRGKQIPLPKCSPICCS
jgi:hypothetical protein